MKNIFKLIAIIVTLVGCVRIAEAQQAEKTYRIGWLRFSSSPPAGPTHVAFRQRMRELGYIEGQNLVIEYRGAGRKHERYPKMAAELVRLKVDVIVTGAGPPVVRAARQATRTIPIVMVGANVDPVEAGFVESLRKPGGNITGLINLDYKLDAKRLELLKEAFPAISRVAILWPRAHQKHAMKEVEAVGEALGLEIHRVVAERTDDIHGLFSAISREKPDALLVASSPFTLRYRVRIIEFAAERRLPAIYGRHQFMDAGGLMSYSADHQHLSRRAATYVDKILKGATPADLPIEQPTKFEFVINLKAARQIGVTIPPEVLYRADRVIK